MRIKKRILAVVGNGMATGRLLDELVQRGASDRYEIVVFGEERGGGYNRILLSKVLAGHAPDSIVTKPAAWYADNGIRLVEGARVTRLNTAAKLVEIQDGGAQPYDLAVLATGSQPRVPQLEGLTGADGQLRAGVFVYRTMDDCLRMRAHVRAGDNGLVLGGGLLGLEAAKVLSDLGLHVTVVQVGQTLLSAQLDSEGGEMLGRHIERCGIFVRSGRTVEGIVGEERVEAVVLDDRQTLQTDVLVLACGVQPRVDVAHRSGLRINKGIIVNDTMATDIPGVYAVGECTEHDGKLYGIVTPVWEQATVLADVLTGANPRARYRGSKVYTRLKVAGVDVASMGITEPELESDEIVQVVEERRSSYRKLIVRGDRLVGAMLVGNTEAAANLVQLFDRGDAMPADPLEALVSVVPGAAAAGNRLVCTCHKVSEAAIAAAIAGGAATVEAVGVATRAGTGCGSCKGELVTLLARQPSAPIAAN